MKRFYILSLMLFSAAIRAQTPTGSEILKRIDGNMTSRNRAVISQMIIHGRRSSRTISSKSWVQGIDKSFTEYLAPAREKGTKMLKLDDNLWMYSPATDRIIQISGHMLRQSVMGSDLSYEDMMENPKLHEVYDCVVIGSETIDNRMCWILTLTAKAPGLAYETRKLWVDQERYVPLKQELFAKSGKLLKKMELKDIKRIENRWFPTRMIFKDMMKSGEGTEFIMDTIEFDIDIPPHLFSKAVLRK